MRALFWIFAGLAISLAGCATSSWNDNLMSNSELIQANCDQLAIEKQRVTQNSAHLADSASTTGWGALLVGMLEITAAHKSGSTLVADKSGGVSLASMSDEQRVQARHLEARQALISTLRSKRNCG